MEMSGPQTAMAVVRSFGLGESELAQAMAALETGGSVLRGMFVPGVEATQWCDRRLLARIHRYTLNRLRQEIEPVASACYMRFLLAWQYADAQVRLQGVEGLAKLIELLAGFEAPAAAWEAHLLPARMHSYDRTLLDQLVTSGRCVWLRLSPKRSRGRSAGTLRTTPIAVVPRPQLGPWLDAAETADDEPVSANAAAVRDAIAARGASFFDDIVAHTGRLRTQCEDALDELAAAGLVTCDSFAGLRALTLPSAKRNRFARRPRRTTALGIEAAGRWDWIRRPPPAAGADDVYSDATLEAIAWTLLRRYGVVFRRVLERETGLPPWRDLLWTFRRLEAAGGIRGGRFVAGFSGEQFAVPEAVTALRKQRNAPDDGRLRIVNATDPLNLVGIIVPGLRLPATTKNSVLYADGEAVAVNCGGEIRVLKAVEPAQAVRIRTALIESRRPPAARLRRRR